MSESDSHPDSHPADLQALRDLIFSPDWARTPPSSTPVKSIPVRDADHVRKPVDRARRRRLSSPNDARSAPPRPRQSRLRSDAAMAGGPNTFSSGLAEPEPTAEETRGDSVATSFVTVTFLPSPRALWLAARQLASSHKAHPLRELASLFLSHPDACDVRLEIADDTSKRTLFQCRACRWISLEKAALFRHLTTCHLEDYFEPQEVVSDPPSGKFTCVARYRLSGALIGPPNHHTYQESLRAVHAACCPDLPFDVYLQRIETVHDPALIEQWKEQVRRQILFRLRHATAETTEPMKRSAAEAWLLEQHGETLVATTRRAVLPWKIAERIRERPLHQAFLLAWRRERRFPGSLMHALRGAFHNRNLFTFKDDAGISYVSAIAPSPLNPSHTVENIRMLLTHIREHPRCTRAQLIQELRPGTAADSPEADQILAPMRWLVEKGHIVEFSDGTLAVPGALGRPPIRHPSTASGTGDTLGKTENGHAEATSGAFPSEAPASVGLPGTVCDPLPSPLSGAPPARDPSVLC